MDAVQQVAQAVLYEGYLLWPYRRSALKNQQRWTLGGVYPRPYSEARGGDDPYLMRTQCLWRGPVTAPLEVQVRFLHVVDRQVHQRRDVGLVPVSELTVAGRRYLTWEESTEREAGATVPAVADLLPAPYLVEVDIPAGGQTEWLGDPPAGAIRRTWRSLHGRVEIRAEHLAPDLFRLTVEVVNTTAYHGVERPAALRQTFVAAHTVLHSDAGEFVSLMDPPDSLAALADSCHNVGAWPVLAGPEGDRRTMLSAPMILYDHPRVAPESPGDLFDATEIDQLLTLTILGLTEEEQREMRDGDPRAREILDRCAGLTPEQLMRLHGAMRERRVGEVRG